MIDSGEAFDEAVGFLTHSANDELSRFLVQPTIATENIVAEYVFLFGSEGDRIGYPGTLATVTVQGNTQTEYFTRSSS